MGDIDAVALALIVDDDVIVEVIVLLNDAEGVQLGVLEGLDPEVMEVVGEAVIDEVNDAVDDDV